MKRLFTALALMVVGCTSSEAPTFRDAGVSETKTSAVDLTILTGHATFSAVMAAALPLRSDDGTAFVLADVAASDLEARLPARAGSPLHLAVRDRPSFYLDVTSTTSGLRDVAGRLSARALSFDGALPETDVTFVAGAFGVEELRVLRSALAPATVTYRLAHGPDVAAVRLRDGRIEALDSAGRVGLASQPPFAVDARGRRRELTVVWRDEAASTIEMRLDVAGLAFPIIVDPAWSLVGSLSNPRAVHAAIRLVDGRVLVVGGASGGDGVAEVFNSATNAWTATGPLTGDYGSALPAYRTPAAILTDGKVVVVGNTGARYDPATNAWTTTGAVAPAPSGHPTAAATLPGGKVLTACPAGGLETGIYTGSTNSWAAGPSMKRSHRNCTMTVLSSGSVLVAGENTVSEVYDPATNTFTDTGAMAVGHQGAAAVLMSSGRVLVAGGGTAVAELYDPATNAWTSAGSLSISRNDTAGALLSTGRVLVAGGWDGTSTSGWYSSAEIYDPATGWSSAGSMVNARAFHTMTPLTSGRVLVAGGGSGKASTALLQLTSSELFGETSATPCAAGWECASGFCTDGVCCDAATCPLGSKCNTGAKSGTCAKLGAVACTAGTECASGNCADGVCCDTACTGKCEACDLPTKVGTCFPVAGIPRGKRPPCTGAGAGTACGDRCDGVDRTACHVPGALASCSSDGCTDGIETHASTCTAGKCSDVASTCGAYACGPVKCKTTCTTKDDCAAGYFCKTGACAPVEGLGTACTTSTTCSTGFCADGVCCGVAFCTVGSSCATEKKGTCSKKLGTECKLDAECGTGFCVDGVCCEGACDGQCEACDVAGRFGRCSAVSGKPHGLRAACDAGSDSCHARTCDGTKDTKTCVAFVNGPSQVCGPAICDVTRYTGEATCNGSGLCAAPAVVACAPYRCDAAGCRTSCARAEHCADGFVCREGKCALVVATCDADHINSTSKDGTVTSCAPYRCITTGECGTQCATSADCAPGITCDSETKTCASPPEAGSGGCNVAASATDGPLSALALTALALAALGLRRRGGRVASPPDLNGS